VRCRILSCKLQVSLRIVLDTLLLTFSWLTPVRKDRTLFLPANATMSGSWIVAMDAALSWYQKSWAPWAIRPA
jgi:hypothetical protein